MAALEPFADGLTFPECPRWHDGALWLSDMRARAVLRYDASGSGAEVVASFHHDDPGGLGWMPDGSLLVVGMEQRCVYRVASDGTVTVHADLRDVAPWPANDLVVLDDGTALVSQLGFDMYAKTTPMMTTTLLRVAPDGTVSVAADDLFVPNGVAVTEDRRTVVVAETWAGRITTFRLEADGSLVDRTLLGELPPAPGAKHYRPDGICVDAENGVWAADAFGGRVVRVDASGRCTHDVAIGQSHALAVALGGDDRRSLFVCSVAEMRRLADGEPRTGRVDILRVDVPGAGLP